MAAAASGSVMSTRTPIASATSLAQLLGVLFGSLAVEIGEHDLRAHGGQRAPVLLAATTGTTGDDRDLAVEREPVEAHDAGAGGTCGNSSANAPLVIRSRADGSTSSKSSCSVFCV